MRLSTAVILPRFLSRAERVYLADFKHRVEAVRNAVCADLRHVRRAGEELRPRIQNRIPALVVSRGQTFAAEVSHHVNDGRIVIGVELIEPDGGFEEKPQASKALL